MKETFSIILAVLLFPFVFPFLCAFMVWLEIFEADCDKLAEQKNLKTKVERISK